MAVMASFFESEPMPTSTKLQNTTILGSGDPVSVQWSYLSRFCYWRHLFANNGCVLRFGSLSKYRTWAIISRGLYIFYPNSEDHFFVFKEVFSENSVLMYSRAAYDGARTVYTVDEFCSHLKRISLMPWRLNLICF